MCERVIDHGLARYNEVKGQLHIWPWNLEPSRSRSQTKVPMETTHQGLSTSNVWKSHLMYERVIDHGLDTMKLYVNYTFESFDLETSNIQGQGHRQRSWWKQEAQGATYRAPEYNVPPFWRIGQGGHLVFPISPKYTNLVEDVEIFLPVTFHCRPFSSFRGEVENVSANQRQGRPSCFSNRPKNINLVEDIEILLPVKFRRIPFSRFRGEVQNVSGNQRPGRPSCFSDRPEKHKLGRGHWNLSSCQVLLNSVQRFQRRSRKCLSQSETRAAILFFWSTQKTQTW